GRAVTEHGAGKPPGAQRAIRFVGPIREPLRRDGEPSRPPGIDEPRPGEPDEHEPRREPPDRPRDRVGEAFVVGGAVVQRAVRLYVTQLGLAGSRQPGYG